MKKMKGLFVLFIAIAMSIGTVFAQEKRDYKPLDKSISTDAVINSRIGQLNFPLGYPTDKTAQLLEDEMLYIHAVNAYTNTRSFFMGSAQRVC